MIVRPIWSFITASGLLVACTIATGQEASESTNTNSATPPAATAPADNSPPATSETNGNSSSGSAATGSTETATKGTSEKKSEQKSEASESTADKPVGESKASDAKPADAPQGSAKAGEAKSTETKKAAKPSVVKPHDPLPELIDRAIADTGRRRLTAGVHTPWQVVHGILAMRWDLMLQSGAAGQDVSAIEWITSGVYHEGQPLWEQTPYGGRGHPYTHPYAFEGHPTQFMGYMTMANIPLEYEVKTPTKIITIRDIINEAKMQVHTGVEITWTLWALAHYEEPDAQWFNAAGEPWSIERLVKMQVDEPVTSGACGGCHGLFVLAYARNMYLSTGKPLRGVWFEADQKVKRYIEEARSLQNSDGTFSANHFKGPGLSQDFATRIATSGHQLEWLMVALPQSRLKEEWVRKGIQAVANDLVQNKHVSSDCGPLFHGMHGLVIYRQRTVPGYLIPKFNSHIKLSERTSLKKGDAEVKASPADARRNTNETRDAATRYNPPAPSRRTEPTASGRPILLDLNPARK